MWLNKFRWEFFGGQKLKMMREKYSFLTTNRNIYTSIFNSFNVGFRGIFGVKKHTKNNFYKSVFLTNKKEEKRKKYVIQPLF